MRIDLTPRLKPLLRFLLLTTVVLLSLTAAAQVYKWVDDKGKVHYSDKKPESQDAESVELKVNTMEGVDVKRVEMYATAWCGYCRKARNYFKKHGIAYAEYDIEKDAAAKRRYDAFGGSGIPVIFVNKQRINGFNESKLDKLLVTANAKETN